MNPEARAVVEAAINAASAPQVVDGIPDTRTVDQRRGDALLGVCRRATVATSMVTRAGAKATVLVTIGLDDLRDRTRPGVLVGGVDGGTVLGPETVRRLACDANILPAVLGGSGQILDLGGYRRAFTSAQVRALWLRDRHCTFPGCTVPGTWADAHHLWHWADGGPTDLDNGTLLCGRHHTIVHRDRLTAILTTSCIAWDRRPGSYDEALALRVAVDESVADDPDPPPP